MHVQLTDRANTDIGTDLIVAQNPNASGPCMGTWQWASDRFEIWICTTHLEPISMTE